MEDQEDKVVVEHNQVNQEIQEHMVTEIQVGQIHTVCQVGRVPAEVVVPVELEVQVQNIDLAMNMVEMVVLEDQAI
jgi:hypothetical protein